MNKYSENLLPKSMHSFINDQRNSTSLYPIIDLKCEKYSDNNTGTFIKEYSGIPENLVINLIVWFVLLLIFTFLRRIGDYGRFGLLQREHEEERRLLFPEGRYNIWTTLFYTHHSVDDSSDESNLHVYKDEHFISWLINLFKLKDKHILEKCGKDALYYLVFQRHLIIYLAIVTVLSISIILPINYTGKVLSDKKVFGSTTIVNVEPNSPVLWVHVVLSWIYLIMCFILMRQLSKRMHYTELDYVSKTVMILNIPKDKCEAELLHKHFNECYNDLIVYDIQFAYDISELSEIDKEKHSMEIGRLTSQKIYEETRQRPQMYPYHCGSLFEVCCCCTCTETFYKTDAIDFYTDCERHLRDRLTIAKEFAYSNPLGIAFVTFKDETMAASFIKTYKFELTKCCFYCCNNHKKETFMRQIYSSVSNELDTKNWRVSYAPSPNNIKWENLSHAESTWRIRYFAINVLLVILMIFFTTPSILIDTFSRWSHNTHLDYFQKYLPDYLSEFLPSLLLRLFSALLPVVVGYTALLEKHWTRSAENHSMMIKTFTILLFMVLILPTLGLNSIDALLTFWFDKNETDKSFKWKCVSDNGAFFLKYVTTCSLIGTALDLLRLPELFMYFIRLFWARSLSERMAVRVHAAYEFDYGGNYAWILTLFTVTICFNVVCPLITPFGLIYLTLKHFVDRYNIYFAYVYTKVDKDIHKSAVSLSISSVIMLQFCNLFFIVIRNRSKDTMVVLQSIFISIACLLFIGRISFGWFRKLSLFNPKTKTGSSNDTVDNAQVENFNGISTEIMPQEASEEAPEVDYSKSKARFLPGLLKTYETMQNVTTANNFADSIGNIIDTDTEIDERKIDNKFNESTMSLSSKYGTVNAEN